MINDYDNVRGMKKYLTVMWKKQEAIKVKWMERKMAENVLQGKCVRPF